MLALVHEGERGAQTDCVQDRVEVRVGKANRGPRTNLGIHPLRTQLPQGLLAFLGAQMHDRCRHLQRLKFFGSEAHVAQLVAVSIHAVRGFAGLRTAKHRAFNRNSQGSQVGLVPLELRTCGIVVFAVLIEQLGTDLLQGDWLRSCGQQRKQVQHSLCSVDTRRCLWQLAL
ncbi:MAG: hypothetical protein LW596_05855 [Ilumatobacteraceae bacterium]|nr:hypothetical protein [Ilumatobacteraceae bacterium]